jgi:N utilization substance protein B
VNKQEAQRLAARRHKARHYAMQALYQWHMAGANISQIEVEFRADNDMSNVDSEYFSELLHRIPHMLSDLDAFFEEHLDRDKDDLGAVELALLRIGSYELSQRIDIPYKVVINEAVNLAKKFGATDSFKYVNGILDKVARQTRAIEIAADNPAF